MVRSIVKKTWACALVVGMIYAGTQLGAFWRIEFKLESPRATEESKQAAAPSPIPQTSPPVPAVSLPPIVPAPPHQVEENQPTFKAPAERTPSPPTVFPDSQPVQVESPVFLEIPIAPRRQPNLQAPTPLTTMAPPAPALPTEPTPAAAGQGAARAVVPTQHVEPSPVLPKLQPAPVEEPIQVLPALPLPLPPPESPPTAMRVLRPTGGSDVLPARAAVASAAPTFPNLPRLALRAPVPLPTPVTPSAPISNPGPGPPKLTAPAPLPPSLVAAPPPPVDDWPVQLLPSLARPLRIHEERPREFRLRFAGSWYEVLSLPPLAPATH